MTMGESQAPKAGRILLLTGMTPDDRIFKRLLPHLPTAVVVAWIKPHPCEPLRAYAQRLAKTIEPAEDTVVCGVSFGGMVARELAFCLNAKTCVLVSSLRHPRQLPPHYRLLRPLAGAGFDAALNLIGTLSPHPRLKKLAGKRGAWHRWATNAILTWDARQELDAIPIVQVHGDRDRTFPIRFIQADQVIQGGGHVLPLTHHKEIAAILKELAASDI